MKNDYLWDRSGVPDAELQELEQALSRFRSSAEVSAFPAVDKGFDAVRPRGFFAAWRMPRLAAASVLAAGVAAGVAGLFLRGPAEPIAPGWDVAQIEGAPIVGSAAVRGDRTKASLRVGETLVT